MGKLIVVTNQKGGVGKTTATVHIVHAASELIVDNPGDEVLVVDLCGQGNTSQYLTGNLEINKHPGGAETLFDDAPLVYTDTLLPNVKLLHGHRALEAMDKDDSLLPQAVALRTQIRNLPFKYIIFDTPPALGTRIAAPLLWSDLAVLMAEPHLSSLTGLDDTFDTIKAVKRKNPGLVVKMAVNRFTKSSKTQKHFRELLQKKFGKMIVEEFTSRTAVADAVQNYLPVWRHSKDKALGMQWRDFAVSVLS